MSSVGACHYNAVSLSQPRMFKMSLSTQLWIWIAKLEKVRTAISCDCGENRIILVSYFLPHMVVAEECSILYHAFYTD